MLTIVYKHRNLIILFVAALPSLTAGVAVPDAMIPIPDLFLDKRVSQLSPTREIFHAKRLILSLKMLTIRA